MGLGACQPAGDIDPRIDQDQGRKIELLLKAGLNAKADFHEVVIEFKFAQLQLR